MKIDKSVINAMNKQHVLLAIRHAKQINKAEIARLIGVSIPTVMKITDEFEAKGLIRNIGKGVSSGGKPPQLLELVTDAHYIVGVDIGTTNIMCIVMDLSANIVSQYSVATNVQSSVEQIIERIAKAIHTVISSSEVPVGKILGIGIGMPGVIDQTSGTVLISPDFHWEMVPLLEELQARFTFPMMIHNVTRAMAMGQKWFGYGQGDIKSFVCINLGHGIGSALYLDGHVYHGGSGSAGELGHTTVKRDGPYCVCGNRGCLEALSSGSAIVKQALDAIELGELAELKGKLEVGALEAKDVFDIAYLGHPIAMQIVQDAAQHIGLALANLINVFDPELIVLEGGLSRAGDPFIDFIRSYAQQWQMKYAGRHTQIVVSKLAEQSAAIGAASLIFDRFIQSGGDKEVLSN